MAFLHGPEVIEITGGLTPIRAARTGVIGLVGTAGTGPVNTPTLIAGRRLDGTDKFGSNGTIPDALDAIFAQIGAAVVVVNVYDQTPEDVAEADYQLTGDALDLPARDVSNVVVKDQAGATTYSAAPEDVAEADYQLAGDALDLPGGDVSNVVVKDQTGATTHVLATDYTVAADTGIITRVPAGALAAGATVKVAYTRGADYSVVAATGVITRSVNGRIAAGATVKVAYTGTPDIDAVTAADIAGDAGSMTGMPTGVAALVSAESVVGHAPRLLIAPGFSDQAAVGAALIAAGDRLRGVAILDGQSTTDAAAATYRGAYDGRRGYLVEPGVQVVDADNEVVDRPASGYVAGLIARLDTEEGFWVSPSNKVLSGVVGTSRPIDFSLGDQASRANLLNEGHIATVVRQNGYRLWGGRTLSTDTKWAFLSVVRIADALAINLLASHLWAVDRNIGPTYIEDVAAGVNAYIADLVGQGALLGGSCRPSPELNTVSSRASGQVYFDVDFTPPSPAERVTFRSRLVQDDLAEVLP